MPTRIPLYYCDNLVGFACVDDDLPVLSEGITWRLRVPNRIRDVVSGNKELIAGLIHFDSVYLAKCTPFTWIARSTPVTLAQAVLQMELIEILNESNKSPELIALALKLRKRVGMVGYKDNDKTNLRRENLREFQAEDGWVGGQPPKTERTEEDALDHTRDVSRTGSALLHTGPDPNDHRTDQRRTRPY